MAEFLAYYRRIKERTLKVVRLISDEHLGFRWKEGTFSLGDLARHIILIERDMYLPNIQGQVSTYRGCSADFAPTAEAIVKLYDDTMHTMLRFLEEQPESFLSEYCQTPIGTPIRRGKWLRAMIEHEIHHRGQLYLMLQYLEVQTPPLFQLTSEDVIRLGRENSGES